MASITAEKLYKVFGRRPQRGVDALEKGATRADLRAQGLTPAVIDATFEVKQGEIFVVMGLSGSGKSTLIRMVNGLLEPTSGTVSIDGDDVTRLGGEKLRAVRREKVSMVFQHFALLPHRTVGDNAAYALEVSGVGRSERQQRADRALEMVGLGGWGGSMPDELSGGMRQRVGLARALASGTDIMLMDEAFSALDPLIRRDMQDQLIELQQELGKTILFITHDLNEAMRLGDRIAMMRDGRIEQIGTAGDILGSPVNDYVANFVQDVDRTRVLTARDVMQPTDGQHTVPVPDDAVVPSDALLSDLFARATIHDQLAVRTSSGDIVGVIPRVALLAALDGGPRSSTHHDLEPTGGAA